MSHSIFYTLRSHFTCCALLFFAGVARAQSPQAPNVFQSDPDVLLQFRQSWQSGDHSKAVQKLLKKAKGDLHDGPYTIVTKKHPLPGINVHEYVSVGPYDWPNPNTADGLPYIRKDGVRNPDLADYDVVPLSDMSEHAYTLALAGYLSGDRTYSDRAALLIRTFLLDPATRMNPDMEHAQMILGVNTGRHAGLLEGRRFMDVIDAIGLLEVSHCDWTPADDAAVRQWFTQYVDWMQNGDMKKESDAPNNHGTWYDVQVVTYRLFLGDKSEAKKVLEKAKSKRIAKEIEPNGDEPKELVRTKSLSYSAFNLLALTTLADLGERADVDLWHYHTSDGRSIRAVMDSLLPYVLGEKDWPHQQIVRFDPKIAIPILQRAALEYHDPAYSNAATKIAGGLRDLEDANPGAKF